MEEYEEYVTQHIKQSARQSSRTQRNKYNNNNNNNNNNNSNNNNSSSSSSSNGSNSRDYYALLGVDRTASQEEIMRNFRVKIMKVHPDYYQ